MDGWMDGWMDGCFEPTVGSQARLPSLLPITLMVGLQLAARECSMQPPAAMMVDRRRAHLASESATTNKRFVDM